jgi:hypothetical protein
VALLAGSTHAQDYTETATYGDVSLSAGFTPDPYSVSLLAGGSTDAYELGGACIGQIATAPDLQLDYDSSSIFSLYIFVSSDVDTSLVVNTPSGEWICDDDSGEELNPVVQFHNPQSGIYDIWVGVVDGGNFASAMLFLSELELETGTAAIAATSPDPGSRPRQIQLSQRGAVAMVQEGGVVTVPVLINDTITLNFIVDSGAAALFSHQERR